MVVIAGYMKKMDMKYNEVITKFALLVTILLAQGGICGLVALNVTISKNVSGPLNYDELVTIVDNGNPNDTVIYTVNGDFSCLELTVEANTIMVVKGDLIVGEVNLNNVDFQVYGTLVVTGSLDVRGKNSLELNIETTGILVVGGSYDYTGKNGGASEDNDGQMYLSDPGDFTGSGNGSGDIGDLIESGVLPSDIEDTFVDNVDETLFTTATWNGGSTQWDWDGNWTNTDTPTTGDNVFIGAGEAAYPQFCTGNEYFMWNLELEAGADLVISAGSKVTILGDITIGAGANLTVENSVAQPTSFLHHGQVNGNITYKWSYNSGNWWLIGHAISNPTIANYDAILAGGNDYAMYDYQDLSVMQKISKTAFDFSAQDEIRGYLLKVKNNAIISHTGLLNSGDVYPKTLQTGWQVIANPYASYYQLPTEASSGADFEHTTGSVYVTVSTSNSDKVYHTFNTITGVGTPAISDGTFNGIIAPTQAFYVETTGGSEGQNVYMRSVHRVHDAAKAALKSGQVSKEQDILRIKLENDNAVDEAVILLREDGEIGLTRMDSKQRFVTGNSLSYIYSLVEDDKAVINVLPNAIEEHQVNLGVKAQAGGHTLKITGLESLTDAYELVLEDKLTESFCEMTTDTEYAFTTAEGDFDDRFVLHFKKAQVPTTIETPEKDKDQQGVKVYIEKRNELFVECDWDINEKNISIYNLAGQLVLSTEFLDKNYKDILNVKTGIYVVKITGEYQSYRQQVFVQ